MEPGTVLGAVTASTDRLTATLVTLSDDDLGSDCRLPGWTRAHLVTHLARNADGLRGLLLAARTGEEVRMYASPQTRAADIVAGAQRASTVIVADAIESSRRFVIEARAMPAEAWSAEVAFTSGQMNAPLVPANKLLEMRLEELELHHLDLGCDYSLDATPAAVTILLLGRLARRRAAQGIDLRLRAIDTDWSYGSSEDGGAAVVTGSAARLLGWLAGRGAEGIGSAGGPVVELPSLG